MRYKSEDLFCIGDKRAPALQFLLFTGLKPRQINLICLITQELDPSYPLPINRFEFADGPLEFPQNPHALPHFLRRRFRSRKPVQQIELPVRFE